MFARLQSFGPAGMRALYRKSYFNALVNCTIASLQRGDCGAEALMAFLLALARIHVVLGAADSRRLLLRMLKAFLLCPLYWLREHARGGL